MQNQKNQKSKSATPMEKYKYKGLLYLRYYSQITLQSCAIKSQLQDHNGALILAKDGLLSCIKVFKKSYEMCKQEI